MRTLGIDIGGSKILGLCWDGRRVSALQKFPTPSSLPEFKKKLTALLKKLSGQKQPGNTRIGIDVAGVIRGNKVIYCPNIPFLRNFDFAKFLSRASVKLDNDARAFLRGEVTLGAAKHSARVLAFTIGTGIGRAYALRGWVNAIKRFEYPESWETKYQKIRDHSSNEALAEFLAAKLALIVKQYRPTAMLIGGGILGRPGFFTKLKRALEKCGIRTKILRPKLGERAAAIGAALVFRGKIPAEGGGRK